MQKKLSALLILILSGALLFTNINNAPAAEKKEKDDLYSQIEIFSDALAAVQNDYVDTILSKDIIYGALEGMLSSLDPYSQFMDQDTYNELQVETEGEFGGLGIEITIKDNLLTIITPLDDTPAHKAGLKALDRIVKIDNEITKDISLTNAVKKMRGKPGTNVTLTIMREGEGELKDYVITRDIIMIKSVRKAELLDGSVGYIKLTDFSEKTKADMDLALADLEKQGMDSLILDLRNNPGGLLLSSVDAASEFIPSGQMVVYTKGREQHQNVEYRAKGKTNYKDIPLIVLINGGSASASEIVAGAIQDHKRGILLGTKSFGKGSVQTVIPLRDGSALRLTTARYYTPSGRSINEIGIEPDVIVEEAVEKPEEEAKKEPEKKDIFEEIKNTTPAPDKPEEVKEKTEEEKQLEEKKKKQDELINNDNQLRAALNLMQGIRIYKSTQSSKVN